MKNAFSVDVEDYFHVAAFDTIVDRSSWESRPSRVVANTSRLLDILASHGVTATFFVLGWVARRHPDLVRTIDAAGHEIACHGHSHRKIYTQDRATFEEETRTAKGLLEDAAGKAVEGYRAASFSITEKSLWALDVLIDNGFRYDSSIAPVWHDNYGIPGTALDPSTFTSPSGASIAEFPMSTLTFLGFPFPASGGGYFRLYPYWFTRRAIRALNRDGRPVNFYMHPWEIDPHQPRFHHASWKSRFRHYNNLHKVQERLGRLLSESEYGTCREVLCAQGLLEHRKAS